MAYVYMYIYTVTDNAAQPHPTRLRQRTPQASRVPNKPFEQLTPRAQNIRLQALEEGLKPLLLRAAGRDVQQQRAVITALGQRMMNKWDGLPSPRRPRRQVIPTTTMTSTEIHMVSAQRHMHTEREKYTVVHILQDITRETREGKRLFRHKLAEIISHNRRVYGNLTVQQADRWIKAEKMEKRRRGPYVNLEFIDEVLNEVAIVVHRDMVNLITYDTYTIKDAKASVIYNYEVYYVYYICIRCIRYMYYTTYIYYMYSINI